MSYPKPSVSSLIPTLFTYAFFVYIAFVVTRCGWKMVTKEEIKIPAHLCGTWVRVETAEKPADAWLKTIIVSPEHISRGDTKSEIVGYKPGNENNTYDLEIPIEYTDHYDRKRGYVISRHSDSEYIEISYYYEYLNYAQGHEPWNQYESSYLGMFRKVR